MDKIFQIDTDVQGNNYIFRVNPETKINLPVDSHTPSYLTISYDEPVNFRAVHENPFVACIHNHLSNLNDEALKKLGFTGIIFYDCEAQKELNSCYPIKED